MECLKSINRLVTKKDLQDHINNNIKITKKIYCYNKWITIKEFDRKYKILIEL